MHELLKKREQLVKELHQLDALLDAYEEKPIEPKKINEKEEFLKRLQPFATHLEKGYQVLTAYKKRGFFHYFFGRHPKVLLSIHLFSAEKEIDKLLKFCESTPFILSQKFIDFFLVFQSEANKTWNPQLYQRGFLELYSCFNSLKEELYASTK